MKILGISPFHDSSVCLIENGKIKRFLKEERLTRVKRDNHPFQSLNKINQEESNIDCAVICSPTNGDFSLYAYKNYLTKVMNIPEVIDLSDEHHLQHASLAFYNSGFDRCLVFVIDRNGSIVGNHARESESVFVAEYPNIFKVVYKNFWVSDISFLESSRYEINKKYKNIIKNNTIDINSTHGIVKVYESATSLIGQHPLENGKVMGLSAYGDYREEFNNLFICNNIGNFNVLSHNENNYSINKRLKQFTTNEVNKNSYKLYADYAYAVQKQTQESALDLIKKYVEYTGIKKVCISGGYALNVVANSYYQEVLKDVEFYFEPIADDTGNSIGGALLIDRFFSKNKEILSNNNTFFHGYEYDINDLKGIEANADYISGLLLKQKIIALYFKKAEAGPRALGHRSILFDARNLDAKNIVNTVKKREWYRPFACSLLREDAEKYFFIKDFINTKNMTLNVFAKENAFKDIPGVIHEDGTCRIQIVEDKNEPLFKILKEFKNKTGIGVLLNTSFNLAGEPLVESPEDAISTLNRSDLFGVWFAEKNILIT